MSLPASRRVENEAPNAATSVVVRLVSAATDVRDAAKVGSTSPFAPCKLMRLIVPQEMKSWRDGSRKISKIALHIATCVENTANTLLHEGRTTELQTSVVAALSAAVESVLQRKQIPGLT